MAGKLSAANTSPALLPSQGGISSSSARGDWDLDVERGPNWLFVRVNGTEPADAAPPPLADRLKSLLEESFVNRMVLEFARPDLPFSQMARQLESLAQWVGVREGVFRLCGPSATSSAALRRSSLGDRFPIYRTRHDAVFGRD